MVVTLWRQSIGVSSEGAGKEVIFYMATISQWLGKKNSNQPQCSIKPNLRHAADAAFYRLLRVRRT